MQVWVPAGGRSEAQASVAAAAFRLSRWGRRLREGPRVSHASPSPPVNMAPGPPRTPPPTSGKGWGGSEADGQAPTPERGGPAAAAAPPGPAREALRRRRPLAFAACASLSPSAAAGGRLRLFPRRRASQRGGGKKKKGLFIETIQPAAAEKKRPAAEASPTRVAAARLGQRDPYRRRRGAGPAGGGGACGQGVGPAGIPRKAPARRRGSGWAQLCSALAGEGDAGLAGGDPTGVKNPDGGFPRRLERKLSQ